MFNKQVIKKFVINFHGNITPTVGLGANVEPGDVIAKGQHFRVLQQIPIASIDNRLVDDGLFITKNTPIAESISLLKKRLILADYDGLVQITPNAILIVDVEDNYKYISPAKGKVSFINTKQAIINAYFYKLWLFASTGKYVKARALYIHGSAGLITSKDIPNDLTGRVLIINGFLTRNIILKALGAGALGIIGASIDFSEYDQISQIVKNINMAIIRGFGQFELPYMWQQIFQFYDNKYIEVDFENEFIYIPVYSLLHVKKQAYAFSGNAWWEQVYNIDSINKQSNLCEVTTKTRGIARKMLINPKEIFIG